MERTSEISGNLGGFTGNKGLVLTEMLKRKGLRQLQGEQKHNKREKGVGRIPLHP